MPETRADTRDPSHDVLRSTERHELDAIFKPATIVVIGATDREGSVGRAVVENLAAAKFPGKIYGVNPHRRNVLGIDCCPSIAAVPQKIDLGIIVTPAPTVPGVVRECAAAGVGGVIVISAGFKEIGAVGKQLEEKVLAEARRGKLRLIGPNCLGVMNPFANLNATFAQTMASAGRVAFLSQSGALCTAILDWSLRESIGFSAFVSTGSMLDVGWGDLIYYFGDDPHTHSILLYMESIGDPRSFLSAAREVARSKPIIVIKAGRTEAAAKAAASHTGALTGSDDVLEAAFRRCGVLRVNRIAELFEIAEVLGKQPRPRGRRLVIVTNAGGPGVLATDELLSTGGELAALSSATLGELDRQLPPQWSHANPVDILGDADAERYAQAFETVAKDPSSDGILMILAPQRMTDPARTAEHLMPYAKGQSVPILASWMGGTTVAQGADFLSRAGIPTFEYPDAAARAFTYLWQYSENLRALAETPVLPADADAQVDRKQAAEILQAVQNSGRTLLTEWESKRLLAAYGIPTVRTEIACTADEAISHAASIGYPVVIKLHSETITHKTDVGGVRLNLANADAVRAAFNEIRSAILQRDESAFGGVTVQPMIKLDGYELILGSSPDSQFGPVLLFGTGGQLVEVYRDRALALPPLTTTLARRMIERTKIYRALTGVRGRKPVDVAALELLLVRFSQMVAEQPGIKEVDINPLLASPEGCVALDARIVLYPANIKDAALPHLAIRPYPSQYVSTFTGANGTQFTVRPIRAEDEPLMVRFHEKLSEETVYFRYLQNLKLSQRTAHERLTRICFIDYDREMALAAQCSVEGKDEIAGIARLSKLHGSEDAEISVLIRDDFQHRGLGGVLVERVLQVAHDENVGRVIAFMLPQNVAMQRIFRKLGFAIDASEDPQMVVAAKRLQD